ncbi:DUF4184 family protein [Streptomyces lydicus]|uniref:DUF4184 family protein n=1 Tax=Streptomyces lydicus TaxID=47763 RepID=UPI0005264093|nr:DUF4184 family protein [Streptomyces lydicus]UEG90901.1 DUF4184 family protein [Streptomyces lydicus]
MPFTLSHVAAVLPAVRRTGTARGPLVASALVAGSLAPDMTYYADSVVPGGMEFGAVTHSPRGVLTVDVLVTVALVGGWLLLREPVLALLPAAWRGRVYCLVRGRPWQPRSVSEFGALAGRFVLSAVLGAATHVVWDAFTHPGRWGTRLIPGLGGTAGGLPVSTYLQYGTSVVASVAMVWFLWSALRREAGGRGEGGVARRGEGRTEADGGGGLTVGSGAGAVPSLSVRVRLLLTVPVILCVVLGAVHRTLRAHAVYGAAAGWFDYLPSVLFGAGAGLMAGLLLYAVAVRLVVRRARRGPSGAGAAAAAAAASGVAAGAAVAPSAVASTTD